MADWSLRSIFGPLITFPNRRNFWVFAKHLIPLIEQRIETGYSESLFDKPEDLLQWHMNCSRTLLDCEEQTPEFLSYRLMLVSLASIQSTSTAATHFLFDIYSFRSSASLVADLREEIVEVLKTERGVWNLRCLNKMVKLDSAIRESMRLSSLSSRGYTRKVKLTASPCFVIA